MATTALLLGFGMATAAIAVQKTKQKLAQTIAEAISEYFEVPDPNATIETKLRADGKVILSDLRLKPRYLPQQSGIQVEGVVENAELTWNWGGSNYVRSATLTVRGVRLRIVKTTTSNSTNEYLYQDEEAASSQNNAVKETGGDDDDDDDEHSTVQQILDHLSIIVTDLTITFEIGSEGSDAENVVLAAKTIQLVPLGRENDDLSLSEHSTVNPPLLQKLVLQSVSLFLVGDDQSRNKPLLEPFSYTYDVKRVVGKRFQGLDSGLEIGCHDPKQGLTLHAGAVQVKALLLLQEMLTSSSSSHDDDRKEEPTADAPQDTADDPYSTEIVLAVPFFKFVLPHDTSFTVPDLKFHYRTNGSVCSLQASGGMLINDVYPAVELEDCTSFLIDLNQNTFLLDYHAQASQQGIAQEVARVTFKEKEIKALVAGMRELLDVMDSTADDKGAVVDVNNPSNNNGSPPWTFALKGGTVAIRVEGDGSPEERQWFQASLDAPSSYVLPNRPGELPSRINIGGATLGPTSFGDYVMSISNATLAAKAFPWTSVDDMQQFLLRTLGVDAWKE